VVIGLTSASGGDNSTDPPDSLEDARQELAGAPAPLAARSAGQADDHNRDQRHGAEEDEPLTHSDQRVADRPALPTSLLQ
jgi:hypothetical protein